MEITLEKHKKLFLFLMVVFLPFFYSSQSQAIPAFARSHKISCTSCHAAFPSLNSFGRAFKTNGYRIQPVSASTVNSDFSKSVSQFPIAMAVVSRPYLHSEPGGSAKGTTEIRAIHEGELFVGGVLYKKISGFFEMETEGEDGFGVATEHMTLNYDYSDNVHFQMAYAPSFSADPYDTLSNMRNLSVEDYNITSDTFNYDSTVYRNADNDGKLQHPRQQFSVFGRVLNNQLFYNLGVGGLTEDKIGSESTTAFARLAFDFTPSLMLGGFYLSGTCDTNMSVDGGATCNVGNTIATKNRNFTRSGFDFQLDFNKFRFTSVFLKATDDGFNSGADQTNSDYYIQMVYFGNASNHQIVPLLRYQSSENNNGKDVTKRVIAGVTCYVQQNFKATIEYGTDTSVPAGADKSSNTSLQFVAAF
ncbi:MAG: hypothetical protein D6797_01410 [Bdellovibrio sp.]|nr:MAG: hypothetical protein D6797_01410 [Bdellovibrio sp.]